MKKLLLPGMIAAAMLAATGAHADETAPSSGSSSTPLIVAGGVLTGLGVANLATSPLCTSSGIVHHNACLGLSIGFGAGLLAAGVPMIVVGAQRRAHLAVAPTVGGAVLSWRSSW